MSVRRFPLALSALASVTGYMCWKEVGWIVTTAARQGTVVTNLPGARPAGASIVRPRQPPVTTTADVALSVGAVEDVVPFFVGVGHPGGQ
jgi:hypothetical protein